MSEIVLLTPADEFIDACGEYQKTYGCRPHKAVISRAFYERLVADLGFMLYDPGAAALRFNGVLLEVVDK